MADFDKTNSSRNHDDNVWKAMGLVQLWDAIAILAVGGYTLAPGRTRPSEVTEYGSP